ncbi:MAG: demethoxyubiquinone hydroxylase family protein [Pseudomonadota bacterium]
MARSPSQIIADILRVNHAGESGAIFIYRAQLWVARLSRSPDTATLRDILGHEKRHRERFRDLMRARGIIPCGALPAWGLGGFALGLMTALLGREAILASTAAVERTVHRHLEDQLRWLADRDPEVSAVVTDIQAEELGHLAWAESGRAKPVGLLDTLIAFATDLLIWLSTYGASARMAKIVAPPPLKGRKEKGRPRCWSRPSSHSAERVD